MVLGHIIQSNPATSVQGPKNVVKSGKPPSSLKSKLGSSWTVSTPQHWQDSVTGAIIGVMVYSFARVSAVVGMNARDYYQNGKKWWFRLHEKGGKFHEIPAHHNAEAYMDAYIQAGTSGAMVGA